MYFAHACIIWIGLLIINITTVIYLMAWTGSAHVLYFGIVYLVVATIGSIFYAKSHTDDTVRCRECKAEIEKDWF